MIIPSYFHTVEIGSIFWPISAFYSGQCVWIALLKLRSYFLAIQKNKHTYCYFLYIEGVSLTTPKKFASLESLAASLANPWNLKVNTKCVCSLFPTNANMYFYSWRINGRIRQFRNIGQWRPCDELRPRAGRSVLPSFVCSTPSHCSHYWGNYKK